MIECHVAVAEVIVMMRNFYPIAAIAIIHPRQSRLRVGLPLTMLIPLIFTRRHLAQVLDAVVHAVAVDVVYLQRRETAVVPSPYSMMHEEIIFTAIDS